MGGGKLPILYSFRRCPYAMRARMSIIRKGVVVEHREVALRDRPEHLLNISPKGTVPVLLLPDSRVIDESLEIMQYILDWQLNESELFWLRQNDEIFKPNLDRYKYPNRFENSTTNTMIAARDNAAIYLDKLNCFIRDCELVVGGVSNDNRAPPLSMSTSLNDCLFPFVRQFANHDRGFFDKQPWPHLQSWLEKNLCSAEFQNCMKKYPKWQVGDAKTLFPER